MTMLISAPLVSANSAITANSLVETPRGPWSTTSSVDGVLEADQREERQRRTRQHGQRGALPLLELKRPARIAAALEQEGETDRHDEQQPAELDLAGTS